MVSPGTGLHEEHGMMEASGSHCFVGASALYLWLRKTCVW